MAYDDALAAYTEEESYRQKMCRELTAQLAAKTAECERLRDACSIALAMPHSMRMLLTGDDGREEHWQKLIDLGFEKIANALLEERG